MKLYFIMNVRFPTEKAHGWQIAKMAEAMVAAGQDFALVVPERKNAVKGTAEDYYGLKKAIPTVRLPVFDAFAIPWLPRSIAFVLFELSFLLAVHRWAKRQTEPAAVLTRDQFFASWFRKAGWKVAFEMHDVNETYVARHHRLGKRADFLIVTNAFKKQEIEKAWGASAAAKTAVLPNGVDAEAFEHAPTKEIGRQRLGWQMEKKYAVYTGHLYAWKGVDALAEASQFLPEEWRVVMVGGTSEDQVSFKRKLQEKRLDRVILVPHVSHAQVLTYIAAADVLVLPNSGKGAYANTTSPIKLWEYLAAKRPVVASNIPAIRELIAEQEAVFVEPDEPKELANGIVRASQSSEGRIQAGAKLAEAHSWKSRAEKLREFLQL